MKSRYLMDESRRVSWRSEISNSSPWRGSSRPVKQIDLGNGPGQSFTKTVKGGVVGLMLDGRGRPLQLPGEQAARVAMLTRWYRAVGLYPVGS